MEAVAENILAAQLAEEADEERKEQMTVIDFKMVTFSLAGKDYAIDIMKVKEIAKAGRFTYVPNTSPFVLGVYNLRGDIIPIIDLRLFFNIEVPERKGNEIENMIIVGVGDQSYGVVIDQIDKVVGIQKSTIQPPHPLFGDISIKYISGVVESNNRLYILLDIDRIFGSRKEELDESHTAGENSLELIREEAAAQASVKKAKPAPAAAKAKAGKAAPETAPEPAASPKNDAEYGFLVESLRNMRHFNTAFLNEKWVKNRFEEWSSTRDSANIQLANEKDADEFLKPFFSRSTGAFWTEDFAREMFNLLPENTAKQMFVWNPGCGNGAESYSLACLLRKRYPDARIRIYAHDVDLLSVSNAPLITIPEVAASSSWMKPFLVKGVGGGYSFNQDIKDMVMFEYHDCLNTNAMPNVDLVFSRDLLSFLPEHSQKTLIADFEEKLKGNGVIVIGENESLAMYPQWHAKSAGLLTVYSK